MLALAPECGCTFACSAPNSAQARVPGELLGLVDHEVAAVVPLARVALGVLVREDRALGGEDRRRGEVLRRDQLDRGVLALDLAPDDVGDRRDRRLPARRTRRPCSLLGLGRLGRRPARPARTRYDSTAGTRSSARVRLGVRDPRPRAGRTRR